MEAIDSVKAQTYPNWEIILVDDGSTDNSHKLYKQLEKDSRIHIYYNGENKGCGYTKRRCAELANGAFCGFLDPDDSLIPEALQWHCDIHLQMENVSVIYSKCRYLNHDGIFIQESDLPEFRSGETFFDYRQNGSMHFASFKKTAYNKTDGINPQLKAGVDQDLYFRLEEVGEIYALNKATYNYYLRRSQHALTSESNWSNLWYWNLVARRDTCIRRGLDEHEIIRGDFNELFSQIKDILLDEIENENLSIKKTHAYRLGNAFLRPWKAIKKAFYKNKT